MDGRAFFIVNPNAAGGRLGRQWPNIAERARLILGDFTVALTTGKDDAQRLAAQAVAAGHRLIVSCGGDGTHNEVLNGLVDANQVVAPDLILALFPFGTGGDLRRSLGVFGDTEAHLQRLRSGTNRVVDIGRVDFIDHLGRPAVRYFLNIGGCGMSGEVVRIINASRKTLGGKASYFLAALRAALTYRYPTVEIRLDDGPARQRPINFVAVANGRFFGGGMMVAPHAGMDDGHFDVVIAQKTHLLNNARAQRHIYRGEHLRYPWYEEQRARAVYLRPIATGAAASPPVFLDIDGEGLGRLPATFRILEKRLTLRVG